MLVLAGLLAAGANRDTADSVLAGGELGASAVRSSAGRIGLAYLISIAALQLTLGVGGRVLKGPEELVGSRKTQSARLDAWRPLTGLALLAFLAHVARRNGSAT